MVLSCTKKLSALLGETTCKHYGDFYGMFASIPLGQKTNLNRMKEYAKIKIFVAL